MIYHYLRGSVPMQKLLQPFDGSDPTYTAEYFLNTISANMAMTVEPEQVDSPSHETLIVN